LVSRARSWHVSLFILGLAGPILFLAGLLTRGLALLNETYLRLGLIFGVLALSAAAAAYSAVRRGNVTARLASLVALLVTIAAIGFAGYLWSNEMRRAFLEVEMVPFEPPQGGILVCPADHSPREKEEARALEDTLRAYVQGAGLSEQLAVRPCYPVFSEEQAQRLGRELRANVILWKEARPVRDRLEETFHITVLGARESDLRLEPLSLLMAMSGRASLALRTATDLERPSTSPYIKTILVPAATGYGFYAVGRPELAAAQFKAALQAANLPKDIEQTLHNAFGLCMLALQRPDLAQGAYEASQKIAPNAQAWVGLGMVAMAGHDWDVAMERFTQAIHVDPYDPASYCGVGVVLAQKRDVQGAMRAYRQAIGLNPRLSVPYALLALAHELDADVNSARQQYQMASLYAGPSAGLARAVERRAEEIRLNPPTPVPTATPRPTPSPTPIPTSAIYQVQKGDTLKTIADKFGVSVSALAEINNLTDINALDIGQTLLIPKKP